MQVIRTHKELDVYNLSFETAMKIYHVSKQFPAEERFSLTDQIRRSSRSVASNIAEAFRKRRYPKAFVAKLYEVEGEAAETQVWLDFALQCEYIQQDIHQELFTSYDWILGKLINMIHQPEKWKG